MNEARPVPLRKGGEMLRRSQIWSTQWLAFHQSRNISQLHLINCLKITVCSGTDCTEWDVGDHPETKAREQFGDRQWTGVQKSKGKRISRKYEYCQFKRNVMGFMCSVASQSRSFEAHLIDGIAFQNVRPRFLIYCYHFFFNSASFSLDITLLPLPYSRAASCPPLRV